MRLYFLRHGIAQDRTPDLPDAGRTLVPAGIEKIERLAKRLTDFEVKPLVIYSSPLIRAKQTAEIVAKQHGIKLVLRDSLGYDFDHEAMQAIVDEHAEDEDIMVVGHEPGMSTTISYIIGGGNITLKKGGLAYVDLSSKNPLQGTLVWLISPKVL
jgi:phosphohistidine phosphatase